MGEKKHYWFCVLSDSNTEDRETHKELGVGSGAAPSLVCELKGDGAGVFLGGGRRWRGTPDIANTTPAGVVCSVVSLPSILLSFLFLMVERIKPRYRTAGDKPSPFAGTSDSFSSSSVRPVTPELWQHSPVDLLFHETPSCSLLSCNQISLLGKHAGSRQEEEYCLWWFITFILLLCQPSRGDMRVEYFSGVNVT